MRLRKKEIFPLRSSLRLTAPSTGHCCKKGTFAKLTETKCVNFGIWVTLVWPITGMSPYRINQYPTHFYVGYLVSDFVPYTRLRTNFVVEEENPDLV